MCFCNTPLWSFGNEKRPKLYEASRQLLQGVGYNTQLFRAVDPNQLPIGAHCRRLLGLKQGYRPQGCTNMPGVGVIHQEPVCSTVCTQTHTPTNVIICVEELCAKVHAQV